LTLVSTPLETSLPNHDLDPGLEWHLPFSIVCCTAGMWACLLLRRPIAGLGTMLQRHLSMSSKSITHFDVLGVEPSFTQSTADLKSKYKKLMVEFHPDRHVSSDEEVKTEMAEKAIDVTRAFNTIGDPLSRALYLLELRGASLDESDNSIIDGSLLMKIMELREEVEGASSDEELRPLLQSCEESIRELCKGIDNSFRANKIEDAKLLTAKLQYWKRIEERIVDKISSKT